ncbi:MAG: hypothetical protein ACT4OL_03730 [Nitrospiraceae bacterium]
MSLRNTLWIVVAMVLYADVGDVWAYDAGSSGSSTSSDPCSNVTFSEFKPRQFSQVNNNTEVAPKSEFSFLASKETVPKSITVTIKGETVPITVTPQYNGFQVTGKLPATVKGTFARVDIRAKGPNQCERGDGWLLKVAN